MATTTTARQLADKAASEALTDACPDDLIRADIATRIVDALLDVRKRRGLNYLRAVHATNRLIEMRRTVAANGPDPTMLVGNLPFDRAVMAAADSLVAALGRRKVG